MPTPTPEGETPLRDRPIQEVTSALQETLGQRMVAFAISEPRPKRIGAFACGEAVPSEDEEKTLRDIAEITEAMEQRGATEAASYIAMLSENPVLDGGVPIILIHDGESERVAAVADQLLQADYR